MEILISSEGALVGALGEKPGIKLHGGEWRDLRDDSEVFQAFRGCYDVQRHALDGGRREAGMLLSKQWSVDRSAKLLWMIARDDEDTGVRRKYLEVCEDLLAKPAVRVFVSDLLKTKNDGVFDDLRAFVLKEGSAAFKSLLPKDMHTARPQSGVRASRSSSEAATSDRSYQLVQFRVRLPRYLGSVLSVFRALPETQLVRLAVQARTMPRRPKYSRGKLQPSGDTTRPVYVYALVELSPRGLQSLLSELASIRRYGHFTSLPATGNELLSSLESGRRVLRHLRIRGYADDEQPITVNGSRPFI